MAKGITAVLVLTLLGAVPRIAPAQAPVKATVPDGSVQVTVAIVGDNATVKPIPLHELVVRRLDDDSVGATRTGLDGKATLQLPVGGYVLKSVSSVAVDGVSYRWKVAFQVSAGKVAAVELTNANADSAGATPTASRGGREIASEMQVFGRVKQGVVKVLAGIASGTAFMVDSSGLLLTNAHVVDGAADAALSVMLDTLTRVPAQVVLRATEADLAVIRINPDLALGRPVARLDPDATAQVGEKVFALGYPLGLELVLTTGVVSSVRDGAIITDININHGNSGGPMFVMDGTVIAVNTFLVDGQNGPGVSGSIAIGRSLPLIEEARGRASALPTPSASSLPVMPRASISVSDAKATVAQQPADVFKTFSNIEMDRFVVNIQTPYQVVARAAAMEAEAGKDRKKREEKAGVGQDERYSELRDFHDWNQYSYANSPGRGMSPVVGIGISPKAGETTGSFFRRLAVASTIGANSKATVRYKSDLRSAAIYRNQDTIVPFVGGSQPMRTYVNDQWVDMRDVANTGYYMVPIEAFAPEVDGTVPVISIVIQDLKNPDDPSCGILKPSLVAAIWNQFEGYMRANAISFVAADPLKQRPDAAAIGQGYCKIVEPTASPKAF
jgi:S1-C subfamily serine protease